MLSSFEEQQQQQYKNQNKAKANRSETKRPRVVVLVPTFVRIASPGTGNNQVCAHCQKQKEMSLKQEVDALSELSSESITKKKANKYCPKQLQLPMFLSSKCAMIKRVNAACVCVCVCCV